MAAASYRPGFSKTSKRWINWFTEVVQRCSANANKKDQKNDRPPKKRPREKISSITQASVGAETKMNVWGVVDLFFNAVDLFFDLF